MHHASRRSRSRARFIGLQITGAAAVLTVSAATLPSAPVPFAHDVQETQLALAGGVASQSSRVVAPEVEAWSVTKPQLKVQPPPRVSAPGLRPVAKGSVPAAVAGNKILTEAAKYVGTPYRRGGTTPSGFDCSGFVSYVYGKFGISLPRSSGAYYNVGTRVSRKNAKPGDIIVSPGHVGIYAGGNLQIDSPRPGKTVQFRSIWQSNPVFVRVTG